MHIKGCLEILNTSLSCSSLSLTIDDTSAFRSNTMLDILWSPSPRIASLLSTFLRRWLADFMIYKTYWIWSHTPSWISQYKFSFADFMISKTNWIWSHMPCWISQYKFSFALLFLALSLYLVKLCTHSFQQIEITTTSKDDLSPYIWAISLELGPNLVWAKPSKDSVHRWFVFSIHDAHACGSWRNLLVSSFAPWINGVAQRMVSTTTTIAPISFLWSMLYVCKLNIYFFLLEYYSTKTRSLIFNHVNKNSTRAT